MTDAEFDAMCERAMTEGWMDRATYEASIEALIAKACEAHDCPLPKLTTMEYDDYTQPNAGWLYADAACSDYYQPAPELIECADGRKRTAAERAAWLDAIHASIRDAATS